MVSQLSDMKLTYVRVLHTVGIFAIVSLMVGDVVRTIDADPSLCSSNPMGNDTVNATSDPDEEFDYPECSASVDIAVTMAFLSGLFMVSA